MKNSEISVSNSQRDRFKRVDLNFGAVKITTLLVLELCLWHPVLPHCQDHAEGVFEQKYLFIHQVYFFASVEYIINTSAIFLTIFS
ncbi:hypothetical protein ANCCAN_21511 [Ancylostoma caninum]|uniref:Uncharacterized protein n=1 Tax=Ancylostoma caninum TaxID=29170 RepID=A0A368FPE8_ANCCA|nr:hypothetical protein ANCCAN_21511 [Ancylostoma caninum]